LLSLILALAVPAASLEVALRRGADVPPEVLSRFEALDRLLDSADALLWSLADGSQASTAASARTAAEALRAMAADFEKLTGDPSAKQDVEESAAKLPAADPLPPQTRTLLFSLEKGSLHRLARLMKERALEAPPQGAVPANALLTVSDAEGKTAEIPVLDVRASPKDEVPPALRALFPLFLGAPKPEGASVVLGRRRLWLSWPEASLYACPAAAQAGGTVRLVYRERGGSAAEQGRFYLLTKALYEAGFAVGVEDGVLRATLDGTRSHLDAEGMAERFVFAARALAAARSLAPRLKDALAGTLSQAESAARLDALARLLAAEGGLPPEGSLRGALEGWLSKEGEREALRQRMSRTLAALHLGEFPEVPVGRRTLSLHYNGPIDAALARGELRLEKDGRPVRVPGYDPLAKLVSSGRKLEPAKRLRFGSLASGLRPVGKIGGLLAERGQWRLPDGRWLALYRLHETFCFDLLARGQKPKPIDAEQALALMDEAGLLRPAGTAYPVSLPPFTAKLTYSRLQALQGGRIYATPYATGEDEKALERSKGLLTTHGGPSSILLAAAAGIPVVDLAGAEWSGSSGLALEEPVFAAPRRLPSGLVGRDLAGWRRTLLREGEEIRFDPAGSVGLSSR